MTGKAIFLNGSTISTPKPGYTGLYADESDKHIKQIDDTGEIKDLTEGAISTSQQYFDKDATLTATPAQIASDARIQNYSVKGNTGAISQVIAAGVSYDVLTTMLGANETAAGMKPAYFDKANSAQSTYLVESDSKFLFPSNLYTYNNDYSMFTIRVTSTIDHASIGANQVITILIKLKRFIDDTVVSTKKFTFENKAARVDFKFTEEFTTFVGDDSDPYIQDGMYVEIENIAGSAASITLKECDVRIFKY